MKSVRSVLSYGSWLGRHAAAFGACFLAFRLLYGAVAVAKARSSEARGTPRPAQQEGRSGIDKLLDSPDFSEVKKLTDAAKAGEKTEKLDKEEPPEVRLRSIMIDFGPPRSEVLINGRSVGNTPYAGQISCRDGDKIRVHVIPRSGIPLEKMMFCPAKAAPVAEVE